MNSEQVFKDLTTHIESAAKLKNYLLGLMAESGAAATFAPINLESLHAGADYIETTLAEMRSKLSIG